MGTTASFFFMRSFKIRRAKTTAVSARQMPDNAIPRPVKFNPYPKRIKESDNKTPIPPMDNNRI